MTSEAVALRESVGLPAMERRTPAEIVREGREQCKALMEVVREAKLSKNLGGSKDHLEVEAWITILKFNGYIPKIVWCRPVERNGELIGYEARAVAQSIHTGEEFGGAEATCRFNEVIEKSDGTTFERWTDDYACESMAQTRAVSKLGRVAFSWVAVLAGFSGTPAEEMDGVRSSGGPRLVVFPFGKHKDQPPSSLPLEDLHRELSFWQKKVADEQNPKFKANNERLVKAIQEAIAEKSAPVEAVASELEPAAMSERDALWAKVKELQVAKEWTGARLVKWAKENCNCAPDDMTVLNLQALKAHLQSS